MPNPPPPSEPHARTPGLVVVYSPQYDIGFFGLERLHPFDSRKYGRAWRALRERFGKELSRLHHKPRGPVTREQLLALHTREYLDAKLTSSAYLARALEIAPLAKAPAWTIDACVLRPMRWATAGTVVAMRLALSGTPAINLAGGYHHASRDRGEGFCVYADVGVAVAVLRAAGELGADDRLLHVDCDAHQGNGVARVFFDDPRVFLFDLYNRDVYPNDAQARRRVDRDLPVPEAYDDDRYLRTLRAELPRFLDGLCKSRPPRLAVYNAGTDIYSGDTLGGLDVSAAGVLARDQFVLGELSARHIPWVMLPSGGYSADSYKLIAATAAWAIETYA